MTQTPRKEYLVYRINGDNDYIALDGFDTEQEARDAAKRMTEDIHYPELLCVGQRAHPDEDSDDACWQLITIFYIGNEWRPLYDFTS